MIRNKRFLTEHTFLTFNSLRNHYSTTKNLVRKKNDLWMLDVQADKQSFKTPLFSSVCKIIQLTTVWTTSHLCSDLHSYHGFWKILIEMCYKLSLQGTAHKLYEMCAV